MEFPTTSEEAEKAKREDVMLFRAQKFAPHEADFERIKNVFLSILKDIKKDMDEKEPTSPPVQMEFLKKLMDAIRELSLPKKSAVAGESGGLDDFSACQTDYDERGNEKGIQTCVYDVASR